MKNWFENKVNIRIGNGALAGRRKNEVYTMYDVVIIKSVDEKKKREENDKWVVEHLCL